LAASRLSWSNLVAHPRRRKVRPNTSFNRTRYGKRRKPEEVPEEVPAHSTRSLK